jgi:hypothetical protein
MQVLDRINKNYGRGSIFLGAEGVQKNGICDKILLHPVTPLDGVTCQ